MSRAAAIVQEAASLIGVPFRHQGRKPAIGVDCVGLCFVAYERAGVEVEPFMGYPACPSPSVLLSGLRARLRETESPEPGDVVVLRDGRSGATRHVGIMESDRSVIVCDEPRGVRRRGLLPRFVETAFTARGRD